MPYEVCYRALLSISVVEVTHTHDGRSVALRRSPGRFRPRARSQDSLAGGPPARWFVMSGEWRVVSG